MTETSATLGFEAKLWEAANALRGSMDAAEYKHVVLGLIFLKYISDAFEEHRAKLDAERHLGADPEDPDEYRAEGIFWVPAEARWSYLQKNARQPTIGQLVDEAMATVERDNPSLKGVLPKDYARPGLDKQRLGQLIDLISNIDLRGGENHARDILGRVYEYFLSQFATAEGKKGGEFYTPRCIVKLLVEMLRPYKGRVYDPCCGSSGMFVQSEEFIRAHGGRIGDISIYGQELNYTTWRLARMNLAIRGIDGRIEQGDSFLNDRFPDLKADYILANPPFNMKRWGGEHLREDKRWKFGVPPVNNANFAWVQHIIHHLAPTGLAGFVLANGSMSSGQSGEGEIRKNIIEADLVDCMVALPDKLFYSTQIPACLWFLARDKKNGRFRDRRGQVLFIDARKMGQMVDRTHRELTDEHIRKIADTYHAWRGDKDASEYRDVPGFCKSATLEEIRRHGYVLTPGRYVGAPPQEEDDEPFEEKMRRLVAELREQQAEAVKLDAAIARNLKELGYDV
ncbi:type I restriction-modification system subunit M [Thermus islandicus]|uniref:class I SAM-dependent DNA methyltransferase n=1 Tax=Thermus islandicus TaxID=540988 RepID=UPI00048BEFBF|nr:class I SAM-dependent DNA methyltransferase [Thermus islandicus]